MLTRILFLVSTLALMCGATGCLLEPLTPEEEAELLAEMDRSGMEPASVGRDSDPEPSHPEASWPDLPGHKSLRTMRGSTDTSKPDPTPWLSTGRDGKPDPTPWNAQQTGTDTDSEGEGEGGESIWGPSDKPDPTPWKNLL